MKKNRNFLTLTVLYIVHHLSTFESKNLAIQKHASTTNYPRPRPRPRPP